MSKNFEQQTLFDMGNSWDEDWQNMPEFEMEDQKPWKTVLVHFKNRDDYLKFIELMGQRMTEQTKSVWFPKDDLDDISNIWYGDKK